MSVPAQLGEAIAGGYMVPFVGSGVSLSTNKGFPSWPKLLEKLAERLSGGADDQKKKAAAVSSLCVADEWFKAAQLAWESLGKSGFNDVMKKCFRDPKSEGADLSVVERIWKLRPRLVITTNYDNVLQWANRDAERILNDQAADFAGLLRDVTPDQPRIWHLHGHISDVDSLILAPTQYDAFYQSGREAENRKQYEAALGYLKNGVLSNYVLLFIGFGMRDEYVLKLIDDVLKMYKGAASPGFALLKQDEHEKLKVGLWKDYNILSLPFADYGEPQCQQLDELIDCVGTAKGEGQPPQPPQPNIDQLLEKSLQGYHEQRKQIWLDRWPRMIGDDGFQR